MQTTATGRDVSVSETAAPSIMLTGAWRTVPGAGHGMRQAHVAGAFAIEAAERADFALLDAAIALSIGGVMYEPPAIAESPAQRLASSAALWISALQRAFRLPVNRQHFTLAPTARSDGGVTVPVFLDLYLEPPLKLALKFVPAAINAILQGSARSGATADTLSVHSDELAGLLEQYRLVAFDNFYTYCAADALDIPVRRQAGDTFVLGTGSHSQWIWNTATEQTPLLAANAVRSKEFTSRYLSRCGLPVAKGGIAHNEQEAVAIAAQLAFPVVVKPSDLDNGRGVSAGIRSEKQLTSAWREARELSHRVLVEKHHAGGDYRLTVAHGDVVLAMRRIAWGVTGNGMSTIAELVQDGQVSNGLKPGHHNLNHPRRQLDTEALGILADLKLSPESVLQPGEELILRRKGNISAGGAQEAVPLASVHPDNIALAVRTAHLMKLDVAGVDLIISDVGKSWREQDAIICEVNAAPQVGGRICPDFHHRFLQKLLGPECRVPVHAVIGRGAAMPDDSEAIAMARQLGCNTVSTASLIYRDEARIEARFQSASDAALAAMEDTATRNALILLDADELIRTGLPCDRFETLHFWRAEDDRLWAGIDRSALRALIGPHYAALTLPGDAPLSTNG